MKWGELTSGEDLVGKYVFVINENILWRIVSLENDYVQLELYNPYRKKTKKMRISKLKRDDIFIFSEGDEVELLKEMMDFNIQEWTMVMSSSDIEIKTEEIEPIAPSENANVFVMNFKCPDTTESLEKISYGSSISSLAEFFLSDTVVTSFPNVNVGDIFVFTCAYDNTKKMNEICKTIRNEYGKDSELYRFAVAEKHFYAKYSGHIIGLGVVKEYPTPPGENKKAEVNIVNINVKFSPSIPYSGIINLPDVNTFMYNDIFKLTVYQWNDVQNHIDSFLNSCTETHSVFGESDEIILRVEDNLAFSKKLDYLVPYFGVHSYMTALYPEKSGNLPIVGKTGEKIGTYFIWSANESPNDSGCYNILKPDGTKLVEIMPENFVLPESIGKGRAEPDLRVVFTKSKDTGKWMFRGVFKAIFDTKIKGPKRYANIYFRVATEIAIKQDSTKAIRLLNLYSAESFK